jgi:ubiquinone/menaquinone biosynthesis C-methylase UbiE
VTPDTPLRRKYVKLCDLSDFDEPAVRERIDDVVPGLEPQERLHRKNWEYAMLTLFLEDAGLLGEETQILSVGAGHEAVLFWLVNRVAKVVATDIYGEGTFSAGEADRTMLSDPASFSPYPYRESHLEVLHMDAKELEFDDDSFDAVFSLSSIEHFGTWADIRRTAQEMGRVLRPGGAAFIATECFVRRSLLGPRVVQETAAKVGWEIRVFTPSTLVSEIVKPSGLELVQPVDGSRPETGGNTVELHGGGRISSTTGADYPHIAVRVKRFGLHTQSWTSVGLALSKPKPVNGA